MARDHARIQLGIWGDRDFRDLPRDAQRMYFVVLTQPRLSYCGGLDYLPSRLAALAHDETVESVDEAVKHLESSRHLIVDRETHELLVRTFVRWDGLLSSPNMVKAMLKDRDALISEPLREALDEELRKAFRADPKAAGWKGFRAADSDLFAKVSGKGSVKGSAKVEVNP